MSALAQTFTATSASALASRKSSSFNARSSLMTSSTSSSSSEVLACKLLRESMEVLESLETKQGWRKFSRTMGCASQWQLLPLKMGTMSARCVFPWFEILSLFLALKCAMAVVWFRDAFVAVARKIENDRAKNPFVRDDTASLRMSTLLCARVFATSFSAAVFERANFLLLKTGRPSRNPLFFSFVFVVDDWGPLKKFFFLNKSWLILILSHSNNTG